jgi:hypothetical protein
VTDAVVMRKLRMFMRSLLQEVAIGAREVDLDRSDGVSRMWLKGTTRLDEEIAECGLEQKTLKYQMYLKDEIVSCGANESSDARIKSRVGEEAFVCVSVAADPPKSAPMTLGPTCAEKRNCWTS